MSCETTRAAMIDARYTQQPRSPNVDEHLRTCAACRAFSEQDAWLDQLLSADTSATPRPGFDTRMFARLAEERRAQPKTGWLGISWLRWWMPVSAGAALATVVGVLLMLRPPPSIPTANPDDQIALAVDLELLEQLDSLQTESEDQNAPSLEALSAVAELDPAVLDALMDEVEP